ncbi:hypothetical protein KUF71_018764 [Frankliniella fusca]|uniref:RNA-directed DNA polymerase n=1 Tax=Frankliniella fusca TaxID=407009 RepID=A0AAE1GT20_9NEOP|nr:hypothetical protein KUF71_018764 [Frankliniella fusca]
MADENPPPQVVVVNPPNYNGATTFDPAVMSLSAWFALFNEFCMLRNVDPEPPAPAGDAHPPHNVRRALFLSSVGARAFQILYAACLPRTPHDFSIPYLLALLETRFQPTGLVRTNRLNFSRRDQKPNETLEEYVGALQTLAVNCNFGARWDEELLDRLVSGLRSQEAVTELLKQDPTTFAQAVTIVSQVLTAHEQARWIAQQQIHRLSWQNTKQTKKKKNQDQSKGQNNRRQDQRADQGASKQSPPQKQKQTGKCYRCGRDHEPRTCPIRSWTCNKCNLVGHLAHMCKTKPQRVHQLETTAKEAPVNPPKAEVKSLRRTPNPSVDQEVDNMFASFVVDPHFIVLAIATLCAISFVLFYELLARANNQVFMIAIGAISNAPPLFVTLSLESMPVKFEIDTGAGVTVMSIDTFKSIFPFYEILPSTVKLSALSGPVTNTGYVNLKVKYQNVVHKLNLITVDHSSSFNPLLGRDWLDTLLPHWRQIINVSCSISTLQSTQIPSLDQIKKLFPRPFNTEANSVIEGFTAKLVLQKNARPIFARAYPLPYGMEEPVSKVLDKMEADGKAIRVRIADWASPALAVPKKDGSIRYVADFKRTINPQLRVDFYPLPTPEQVFATLANGQFFTSLDLSDAYTQLNLDSESQELCVINTHKGLYKITRLIYGVSSAAAIFQSTMDQILTDITGVICYLDNILIKGHPGIVKTKLLARSMVWWPSMNSDIENLCNNCTPCAKINFKPKKMFVPWVPAKFPFERVHVDFYCYKQLTFFLYVDSFSKWIHIQPMLSTVASAVNAVLFSLFSFWGCIPSVIVSDNGPPFQSKEFADFLTKFNILLKHTPVYHPASNGLAERGVAIAKKALEKMSLEVEGLSNADPLVDKINMFLFTQHNTPSTATGKSPNELLLSFKPRTILSQCNPTYSSSLHNPLLNSGLKVGDRVHINFGKHTIEDGIIVAQAGKDTFIVNIKGINKEVHANHMVKIR